MISIIISSARPNLLEQATINISETIGLPFELLSYDNSAGKDGLCTIYNRAAVEAKYDILCYMHEDLDIKTKNWGKVVVEIFESQKDIGAIGVAGSSYKSYVPSGWSPGPSNDELVFCNYIQGFKDSSVPPVHFQSNMDSGSHSDVVSVDGMWFCTPKLVAIANPFDEETFKGFHCYDLDYCMGLLANKYRTLVTYDVLLEHSSEGSYNSDWLEDTLTLHEKWKDKLPLSLTEISEASKYDVDKTAYKRLIEKFVECGYPKSSMISLLMNHRESGKISRHLFFKMIYYVYKFYAKYQKLVPAFSF
jgi:hypothetical protein